MDSGKENIKNVNRLQKRKIARIVCVVLVLILLLGTVIGSYWGLRRFLLTENPHFLCRNIDFEPTAHFSLKDIQTRLEELGEEKGCVLSRTNILKLDMEGIRKHFLKYSVVRNVEIRRIMPGTVKIVIEERKPVATLGSEGKVEALIDRDGVVFSYYPERLALTNLPFITMIRGMNKMPRGEKCNDRAVRAALTLIETVASHAPVRGAEFVPRTIVLNYELQRLECYISGIPGNRIFAKRTVVCVPFDAGRIPDAMDRFYTILALKIKNGETISFADVTLEKNVNTMK